jgi:LacI family transcriptional regulator
MVKLKDVARKAGVSEATASLVLNKRPGVSIRTRKKVLEAAQNMGYSPNKLARSLALRKTNTVGLVVTDIENPFFGSVTRYCDEYIRDRGYNLILSISNDDLIQEEQIINNFISERVDGVIVVPTQIPRQNWFCFKQLEKHRIPFVFSTTYYDGINADCVMTDLQEGSFQLTKYLIELGHRKILFLVSAYRSMAISKLRIAGCMQAFENVGLFYDTSWIIECKKNDYHHGYRATLEALKERIPDSVIAINDIMALGAKRALQELGYRIPDDISVAGYDDVIFSSVSEIPLTSVKQDIPSISRETVNLLMEKIQRKNTYLNRVIKIKPELIVRKSTGFHNYIRVMKRDY